MSEEEYISNINKFITDLEQLRDKNILEGALITGKLHWQLLQKTNYESKASAYDFVIRKLRRTFNLINNGKETNT